MDVIRVAPITDIMWDLLIRCTNELPTVPMEAWSLAGLLRDEISQDFLDHHGEELGQIEAKLREIRSQGQENLWW